MATTISRTLRRLTAAAFALVATLSPALSDTRVALVIGNGAYRNVATLPNTRNDADDMAAALGRLDFTVTSLADASFDAMRRALIAFGRQARDSDIALLFFAGHGMEVGGQNWLLPIDAELRSDTDAETEALALSTAMQQAAGARQLGLVILDACRNNPFVAKMASVTRSRSVSRGLARTDALDNVLVAYAAKEGTTADDGSGRNSPFTAALLKNIETPGLEVTFLFRNVRDDVMATTRRAQTPAYYASLSRESVYLKPALQTPPVATATPSPALDAIAWRYVNRENAASLKQFLSDYPASAFAVEARAKIAALEMSNATSATQFPRATDALDLQRFSCRRALDRAGTGWDDNPVFADDVASTRARHSVADCRAALQLSAAPSPPQRLDATSLVDRCRRALDRTKTAWDDNPIFADDVRSLQSLYSIEECRTALGVSTAKRSGRR